jgi:pimeloyl-ACP methyl ester carboxylesterase
VGLIPYFKSLGQGPALVVLHGGPGADHRDFLPFLRPLARRNHLTLIDERAEALASALPNAKLTVLSNCGHMMYVDQTRRFNDLVSEFLSPGRSS